MRRRAVEARRAVARRPWAALARVFVARVAAALRADVDRAAAEPRDEAAPERRLAGEVRPAMVTR
ncbi:hypothetical protein GCM10009681_33610 [Luedemannella helvata]|uniref:Uncharacterized protein n=1 Tax=Luedemannella helvata TaxID=349315 RepID=A0ABP4WRP4_9ACTN